MTKLAAAEQARMIESARQLLGVLVHLPEIRSLDPALCDPLLSGFLKQNPLYASFGVVDRNGMIICSGLPFSGPINDADRLWFRRAVETRAFAVGDYEISRTAHVPTLHFSCPFFDDNGNIRGVIFAGLDLKWLSQLLARVHLPKGTVSTVMDASGKILERSIDAEKWAGQSMADAPLIKTVLARRDEGTVESPGLDGVIRLYAFTPLKESGGPIVGYVILGIPSDAAYADANRMMVRNLVFTSAAGAFAVAAAWVFSGAFVLRRTKELIAAANRFRAGDLTSRTRPDHQFGEFTDVAIAFDEMADALEQRISELNKAHAELFLDESRLEVLLKLNSMIEAPMQEITDFALEESVQLTQSHIAYVAFINEDETVLTMHSWSKTAMAECRIMDKPIIYPVENTGLWGEAVRQRKAIITNDYQAPNPLEKGYPLGHVHVTRHMNVPIFDGNHAVIVAGVGNKETPYDQSDVRQLTLLMQGMWRMIQRKRTEGELKQHREHLEELVAARTEALKESNEQLSESNEQLNAEINERKQAEESLRQAVAHLKEAQEELKRSNEELQQFAYVASHDLQEPLRMVASYTQLLEKRYKDKLDADAKDFIGFAVDGALRMQQLINDLLQYSRVGSQIKGFEPTPMGEVFDWALRNLDTAVRESGATVTRGELPVIQGDAGQLLHLFQNLIANGIKFRGQAAPQVEVTAEERPEEWVFRVRDNGIGIEPEFFDRIFVIFQRLHTRDKYPGTGIGLALCKKIVERHGGRIWVESTKGQGATFVFVLPKNPPEEMK